MYESADSPPISEQRPLAGVRVLDFSRLLPGPYATMLLADLGAEVIKVETPRLGDYARSLPPEFGGEGMFQMINRNKKSLGLNYRNQRGRQLFLQLAETADVLLESFRPGAMARWGFDYPTLRAHNPRLIYCSLSGYGQSGPYRDRAGHDINYIAVGGLLGLNGAHNGPPLPPGVQIADLGGGMLVALAILSALFSRTRTGQGTYLDVAMLDIVVSWVLPIAAAWFFSSGQQPPRGEMPLTGGLPCYNVYPTADGKYLSLGALEPHFWGAFCSTLQRADWIPRQFDSTLTAEIAAHLQRKTQREWLERFEGVDACLEAVNTLAETLAHPQVRHRNLVGVADPQKSPYPPVGSPLPFPAPPESTPAPPLGAHTRDLLTEIGLSPDEIEVLHQQGVIKIC